MPPIDHEKDQLRARVRDLELALGQGDAKLAAAFRLTPVLNNLFGLLLSLQTVTPEMIRQRLEIAPDAKVAIHRLRAQLKPWAIEIESRRNVGYWLSAETKAKILALLAVDQEEEIPSEVISDDGADRGEFSEAA